MTDKELQEQAEANVGFYKHLLTYIIVNLGLIVIDYYYNGRIDWALYPLLGWFVGLLTHYIQINSFKLFSVEKEKERLRNKSR